MLKFIVIYTILIWGVMSNAQKRGAIKPVIINYKTCEFDALKSMITKLNPNLATVRVYRLVFAVCQASEEHGVRAELLIALMSVESNFKVNAINSKTADYGLTQINMHNIEALGLNKNLLLIDVEYAVDAGAMILSWFKKTYAKKERRWYCRYNVGVRPLKGSIKRLCGLYASKLEKRLKVYKSK